MLLQQVPAGRVTTYGALARALGNVKAARWVATFLLDREVPARLNPHRVVMRDGKLGDYFTGDSQEKAGRLEAEGIVVHEGQVDLSRFGIDGFASSRPLEQLEKLQTELQSQLSLSAPAHIPRLAGGVDVSYASGRAVAPVAGVAAYALVDVESGELEWSMTLRRPVCFPYIPNFLSFRELPLLLELLDEVREQGKLADVVFVDGNGILHERRAGIASHLGVAAGIPTIGIGKSLLCGSVDLAGMQPREARPVSYDGRTVAMALKPTTGGRPILVSPGHRTDVPFALDLATRLLCGHRVPEPIFHAHAISRREVCATL